MHCGDQRHAGLCLGRRPCTSRRRVQGRSQGTTLRASDLHNARATILNPFINISVRASTKSSKYWKCSWISCWYIQLLVLLPVKSLSWPHNGSHFENFEICSTASFWPQIWKDRPKLCQKKCFSWWWCHRWHHRVASKLALYRWAETWCANILKMEDSKCGVQTRCRFSHFNIGFRLETDVQERSCWEWIHAISNMTGAVLFWYWAPCESWRKLHEQTWYNALTYIASKQCMRECTLRCTNVRFLVPTNEYRLLVSLGYHL